MKCTKLRGTQFLPPAIKFPKEIAYAPNLGLRYQCESHPGVLGGSLTLSKALLCCFPSPMPSHVTPLPTHLCEAEKGSRSRTVDETKRLNPAATQESLTIYIYIYYKCIYMYIYIYIYITYIYIYITSIRFRLQQGRFTPLRSATKP